MALWMVPVFSQKTEKLCWEACARMLWHWRHKSLKGYSTKAGKYLKIETGLTEKQMNVFYKKLGMRSFKNPKSGNLRKALKSSPVIFTSMKKKSGHAMITTAYGGAKYTVVNPCAVMTVDFDGEGGDSTSCSAGTTKLAKAKVEGPLGSYIWYW